MKRFLILILLVSQCFGATRIITSFNSGELSPLLEGRTDIQKYYFGCRTLENLIPVAHGSALRRPGSKYIASAKFPGNKCRLLHFEFSAIQAYIIEAGNKYMRFYKDGGQILSNGSPFEISTPYLTEDLFELMFIQSADTMYIVQSSWSALVKVLGS